MQGEQYDLPAWVFEAFTPNQIAEGDFEAGLTASRLWWRSIIATRDASSTVRMVAAVLMDRMGASGQCWYSMQRIADLAGVSKPTARKAIRLLAASGWLEVEERRGRDGRPTSNRYWLAFPEDAQVEGATFDDGGHLVAPWSAPQMSSATSSCTGSTRDGRRCRRQPAEGQDRCPAHPKTRARGSLSYPLNGDPPDGGGKPATPQGVSQLPRGGKPVARRGSLSYPDVFLDVDPDVFQKDEAALADTSGRLDDDDAPSTDRFAQGRGFGKYVREGVIAEVDVTRAAETIEEPDERRRFLEGYRNGLQVGAA